MVFPSLETLSIIQDAERRARSRLAEFLASGPLYSQLALDEKSKGVLKLPQTLELHCAGGRGKVQTFERVVAKGDADMTRVGQGRHLPISELWKERLEVHVSPSTPDS